MVIYFFVLLHYHILKTLQLEMQIQNILLLHKLRCPAVLVECGFLSNEEEQKKLLNEDYQKEHCLNKLYSEDLY